MSMRRSDLPHVTALDDTTQRMAVDAMWRAYNKAELRGQAPDTTCPMSYVATMVEMLEAALNVVQELDFPGQAQALRRRAEARGLGDWATHHIRPSGEPYMAQVFSVADAYNHPHGMPETWDDAGGCTYPGCPVARLTNRICQDPGCPDYATEGTHTHPVTT
jgi:hypothetical protein